MFLLNLWIPLHQITRPLALMDHTSLDRVVHQVRHGLPVASFLARSEQMSVNDIWFFLHHPDQRWWFSSAKGPSRAYAFQTLSTPHGSTILPGEGAAEQRHLVLQAARAAGGDPAALALAGRRDPLPEQGVTAALRQAVGAMDAVLDAAVDTPTPPNAAWLETVQAAQQSVVRRSIELRGVAVVTGGRRATHPRGGD